MTWDLAIGILLGALGSAGFAAGRGYERARLLVAARSERPAKVEPAAVTAAS